MTIYRASGDQARALLELPEQLPTRPAGYYGASLIAGKISGFEHNYEFSSPRRRALMVTKMLRTSPVLSLAEELLTSRVTSVRLTVPRRNGVSEEAADALEMWLGLGQYEDSGGRIGDLTTDDLLRHLMSAKVYGHVLMSESWTYDEGLYFCSLHRRHQQSYSTYITENEGSGRLLAVTQRFGDIGTPRNGRILPMRESLWYVNGVSNWFDGESVLRPVYPHWRSATMRYRLEDLLASKYADPPILGKIDLEAFYRFANNDDGSPPTRDDLTEELAHLASKITGLSADESGHLLVPSWWSFQDRAKHSYDPSPLLQSASHHERVMAEKLYVSTLLQGRAGDSGSRAMVSTQSEVIVDAIIDTLQSILNALNRQTVRRFMQVNFSGLRTSEYPIVSFERASVKRPWWQENSSSFADFVMAGILSPTPEDERAVRAASDLPPIEDNAAPSALDRRATAAGGRLRTPEGQREARAPGASARTENRFVNRLVERGDEDGDD